MICVLCCLTHTQDFQNRAAVPGLNGFPPLLDLLCSEFPVIQQLAMRTIETITSDRESLVAFRNAQGLNKILEVLANKVGHLLSYEICMSNF